MSKKILDNPQPTNANAKDIQNILARIGVSFANLFKRMRLLLLRVERLEAQVSDLNELVKSLLCQLEAATDEDICEDAE